MNDVNIVDITPENIVDYGVCGYKDIKKHKELRSKVDWFTEYYAKGLRMKVLYSEKGGYQGMLEYIPGEYAHRPVDAEGYMFIHCIMVGLRKEYKGKGYGSSLIEECIKEAKELSMLGVAILTRKSSFMANEKLFIKKGFKEISNAKPDFKLLVLKFNKEAKDPQFKTSMLDMPDKYKGKNKLTVLRSPQCPYTEKNVNAIVKSAKEKYKLNVNLIDLKNYKSVQESPCAFGVFCIIYEGEVISYHPISGSRFDNIMNKLSNK